MIRLLQVALAIQCFALGVMHLFGTTAINDWLVMSTSEAVAASVDRVLGLLLIVASGMLLAKPVRWVLLAVAAWFLFCAIATWVTHASDENNIFFQLAPAAQAVRYLSPVALLLLLVERKRAALWTLLLATFATFLGHGVLDVLHAPQHLELLNNNLDRLFDLRWPPARSQKALQVAGFVSLAVAGILLLTRWRWVAWLMALWGIITAVSWITAGGWAFWPETLLRVCTGAAPLALALLVGHLRSANTHAADQAWDFAPPKGDGGTRPAMSPASPTAAPPSSPSSQESGPRDIYG